MSIISIGLSALILMSTTVARSASGTGPTRAAALQDAKNRASDTYPNEITSWGREECSQQTGSTSEYEIGQHTYWVCTVEFTTSE